MKDIYVSSNDTDVVVILVAYMPDSLNNNNEVYISLVCVVGVNLINKRNRRLRGYRAM